MHIDQLHRVVATWDVALLPGQSEGDGPLQLPISQPRNATHDSLVPAESYDIYIKEIRERDQREIRERDQRERDQRERERSERDQRERELRIVSWEEGVSSLKCHLLPRET